MAVDSTPAYGPARTFPSTSITDSTAAGRALLTAASASAQRTLLGLTDQSSFREWAVGRAHQRVTFTSQVPGVLYDGFHTLPAGTNGSPFRTGGSHASGSFLIGGTGYRNGVVVMHTGANTAGFSQFGSSPIVGQFGYGQMDDLVAASSKWHFAIRFRITSTPSALTRAIFGFTNLGGSAYIGVGIRGASSTAKFAASTYAGSAALSTVSIDTGWHTAEFWHDGGVLAGTTYMSFDDETAVPFAVAWGQVAGAFAYCDNNGNGTDQVYEVDDVCWVTEGN